MDVDPFKFHNEHISELVECSLSLTVLALAFISIRHRKPSYQHSCNLLSLSNIIAWTCLSHPKIYVCFVSQGFRVKEGLSCMFATTRKGTIYLMKEMSEGCVYNIKIMSSIKPKWKFWPTVEAEPPVVKITEYSAEDKASAENLNLLLITEAFVKNWTLMATTQHSSQNST